MSTIFPSRQCLSSYFLILKIIYSVSSLRWKLFTLQFSDSMLNTRKKNTQKKKSICELIFSGRSKVDATSIFQYTEWQLRGYMNTMNSFNNLLGEALSWWRVSEGIYSQFTMSPLNVLTQAKLCWVDTDDPHILSPAMVNMFWSRAIGRQ